MTALHERASREALMVDRAVRRWVEANGRLELVDLDEHALGDFLEEERRRLETARAVKETGVEAYDMMSFETAVMRLDRAIEAYEQLDLTKYLTELLDTYFMRTLTLFYEGQPSRARNQILDIFALDRGYSPDSGRITPEIEGLLDEGRRAVDESPETTLEIQTDPVPAWVYVDGRFRGVSPVELGDLEPGHHFVTARAPGYRFAQERHLAAPGQIARLRLSHSERGEEMLAHLQAVGSGIIERDPASQAMTLARWVGSDNVLAIGVRLDDEGVVLHGWRFASDGHLKAHARTNLSRRQIGSDGPIAQFLDGLYADVRPRGDDGEPIRELHVARSFFDFDVEFGHKGWGLVATSAGVATAVGGVFMGLAARSEEQAAKQVPQLDMDRYVSTMRGARLRATAADTMFIVAGLGAAAGVYLLIVDEPPWGGWTVDEYSSRMGVVPTGDGAALMLGGSF